MTTPSPQQELQRSFSLLQTDITRLQDGVRLKTVRDRVEDIQTTTSGLPQRLAILRQNGYVFEKELEGQAETLNAQWKTLHPTVMMQINQQSAQLQGSLLPLEGQLRQLSTLVNSPASAQPLLSSLKTGVSTLQGKVTAAESTINGMFDKYNAQLLVLTSRLAKIEWMLKQLAEASFKLLPTEGGIMAVKAVWYQNGKEREEDPDGVLYLTDQRLIFEQKEEIATKKVLFIATEKKKVQELRWEAPVALIESVTTSKQGMMKNEDHIHINFASGAPYQRIDLHIWQPCDEWVRLINRAKTHDFDAGRAVALDQAAVEAVRNLPTQCPSCGANFDQVVLRGQQSIKCAYCGFEIRL
ncbi:MAG: hypothetical protein WHV44_00295 [Anaerolineales bacterium]